MYTVLYAQCLIPYFTSPPPSPLNSDFSLFVSSGGQTRLITYNQRNSSIIQFGLSMVDHVPIEIPDIGQNIIPIVSLSHICIHVS